MMTVFDSSKSNQKALRSKKPIAHVLRAVSVRVRLRQT